ncbi:2-phosphosulfolactate phosphatase [Candidatus Zixiibacteriota bacterium]
MIVEVYFTPDEFAPDTVAGKTAVVVDILRASTVSAIALQNGAAEIYPAASLAAAEQLADRLADKNPLLCGEREGKIVPGYDLGNSPLEYTPDKIGGRTIIHCSTNGTVALAAVKQAAHCFMVGLVNTRAAVEELARTGLNVAIACGGQEGTFALEDAFGAGRIIALLAEYFPEVQLGNDHAGTVEYIYGKNRDDPLALIKDCSHGRYLAQLGFTRDLEICAQLDTVPVVPRMAGEILTGEHFAG